MAAIVRLSARLAAGTSGNLLAASAHARTLQPRMLANCINGYTQTNQTSHKHTMVDIETVGAEITGAILPWAQQNFFQKLFAPFNYPVMYYMDFLTDHMPWWLTIVVTTATVKLVMSPFILKQNVIGIKLHNLAPQTQKIQEQLNEAMSTGNNYEVALQRSKLFLLYKEHNVSIFQRLWPSLIQTPVFASIFLLLRRLSNHPIETMLTGGCLWFENLTIPDPLYLLPLMTSATLYILMRYGFEGSAAPLAQSGPVGKWAVRVMPVILFGFTFSFPAAVLVYWTSTNAITLLYARLFRIPAVKRWLNIPECQVHDPKDLPISNATFMGQIKKAVETGSRKRTSLDVRRLDEVAFKKAGVGPLTKTYKTKPVKSD